MSETDGRVIVDRVLPRVASVTAEPPTRLAVTWASGDRAGQADVVDLAPMLFTRRLYKPLRGDAALFRTAHVAAFGSAVAWGADEAIDVSAVALEELAAQTMTTGDFRAFIERNGLTLDSCAAQLGLSRRMVAYYAQGREIPRTVALACKYIDAARRAMESGRAELETPTPGRGS